MPSIFPDDWAEMINIVLDFTWFPQLAWYWHVLIGAILGILCSIVVFDWATRDLFKNLSKGLWR
jgi:hypothetical protein